MPTDSILDARKLYPDCEQCWDNNDPPTDPYWNSPYSYQPIITAIERIVGKVVVKTADDDWLGDTYVAFLNEHGTASLLVFGWGSCSGCDALQGSYSYDDLQRLIDSLYSAVKYYPSLEALYDSVLPGDDKAPQHYWPYDYNDPRDDWGYGTGGFRRFLDALEQELGI